MRKSGERAATFVAKVVFSTLIRKANKFLYKRPNVSTARLIRDHKL